MLLNNKWIIEEIKNYLETNKNFKTNLTKFTECRKSSCKRKVYTYADLLKEIF